MSLDPEYTPPNPKPLLPSGATVDTLPRRAVDVVGAFNALRERAEHIGSWDMGRIPDPVYTFRNTAGGETRSHFQGVQRLTNHPMLVVSGGDLKNRISHLFVVQCTPRSTWGPAGSNLWSATRPPGPDRLRRIIGLDPARWHAGGISVLGDIVAVPLEGAGNGRVVFLDLSSPANPRWAQPNTEIACDTPAAGAAALTRLPDGRFLCAVWRDERKPLGEKAGRLDFFVSAGAVAPAQRLTPFEPVWQGLGAWSFVKENAADPIPGNPHYQSISFVWDRSTGQLFLIATRNTDPKAPNDPGQDMADLFGVLPPASMAPPGSGAPLSPTAAPALDYVATARFKGADLFCNFAGGGGAFVSESGALALYGAFHFRGDGIFRLSEFWSHLAEGATWWVDLFERSDFTGHRFSVLAPGEGRIDDYRQRFAQGSAFDDTVVSARFCLPAGVKYRLFREAGCPNAPGTDGSFDLVGTGGVVEVARIEALSPNFGRQVRSSNLA